MILLNEMLNLFKHPFATLSLILHHPVGDQVELRNQSQNVRGVNLTVFAVPRITHHFRTLGGGGD